MKANPLKVRKAMEYVRDQYDMPVQQLEILLALYEDGGDVSHPDLEDITGLSQFSISRNVQKLGTKWVREKDKKTGRTVEKQIGYGLLEQGFDRFDTRRKAARINASGKAFIEEFLGMLCG
jgi:DNA-binding MarR family transcriptional regulator